VDASLSWPLTESISIYNEVLLGRGSLDRLPVGILLWAPDGSPLYGNRRARAWLGGPDADLPTLDAFSAWVGDGTEPLPESGRLRVTRAGLSIHLRFVRDAVRNLEGHTVATAVYLVEAAATSSETLERRLGVMVFRDGRLCAWTVTSPRMPPLDGCDGLDEAAVRARLEGTAVSDPAQGLTYAHYRMHDGIVVVEVLAAEPDAPEATITPDRLIAATAHEIRNPLATIRGFLQILPAAAAEDRQRYAAMAMREVDRIVDVVDEFLAAPTKDPDGEPPTDLFDVVDAVAADLSTEAGAIGVALEVRGRRDWAWVAVNTTRLRQVVTNLVANAMAAVPRPGGHVAIEVERDGNWARLSVADDGPGIPDEWVPIIFEPGFSQRQGGHGLGLAIVRWIVTMYRGHIEVGPSPLGGAQLTVRLPVYAVGRGATQAPPPGRPPAATHPVAE